MNNLLKIYTITALFILSCTKEKQFKEQQLTSLVNPFVGTGGHGHTFPGASMPFGMMQELCLENCHQWSTLHFHTARPSAAQSPNGSRQNPWPLR